MYRRYLLFVSSIVIVVVGIAVSINLAVDPYNLYGTPRIEGFNALKPFAGDRGRTSKPYQALRTEPQGLIVGNSKSEMGLDPEHACWPDDARPVYNIALPGLALLEQFHYANHGIEAGDVGVVAFGLDFADFHIATGNIVKRQYNPDIPDHLITSDGSRDAEFHLARARNFLASTLSLDKLSHSVLTLVAQQQGNAQTRTALGFNPAELLYQPIIRTEGIEVLTTREIQDVASRMDAANGVEFPASYFSEPMIHALNIFIDNAKDHDTVVHFFIHPSHVEYFVLLEVMDLWEEFEQWKRDLVAIIAQDDRVKLWDFTSIDGYTTETLRSVASKHQPLQWFWGPVHYRQELGDILLANLFQDHCPAGQDPTPYGLRLQADNVDVVLERQRAQLESYVEANPDIVARVEAMLPWLH